MDKETDNSNKDLSEDRCYFQHSSERFKKDADHLGLLDFVNRNVFCDLEGTICVPLNERYHNVSHCMSVAHFAVAYGESEGLSLQARRNLLIAGLFHDAGHCQQCPSDDHVNIQKSVEIFRKWDASIDSEGLYDSDAVERLMWATLNSLTEEQRMNRPIDEQIMSDADLSVMTDSDFEEDLRNGLLSEGLEEAAPAAVLYKHYKMSTDSARNFIAASLPLPS